MDRQNVLDRLFDELFRLENLYQWDPIAVEALEKVQFWAVAAEKGVVTGGSAERA